MLRIFFVTLCHAALLIALADDWLATQTAARGDAEAAAADNDLLSDQLTACQMKLWHIETVPANDPAKILSPLDAVSVAAPIAFGAPSRCQLNQFLGCHIILQC